MKITLKTGLIAALTWMIIKMIFHFAGMTDVSVVPTVFINMFVLLSAIAIGLYLQKKEEGFAGANAMDDIKSCMRVGLPYTILVAAFIYLYYAKINPQFITNSIDEIEMNIRKAVDDPEQLKQIRSENQAFEVMGKEQIYEELIGGPKVFISANSTFIISLLGMLMLSVFYSILITIVFRQVLFRNQKK